MREFAIDKAVAGRAALADYLKVAKPGIVALVLVSALTGIYLAGRGLPEGGIVPWTLLGVGMATAGSAILNNFVDRDIDGLMERTRQRALASDTISPAGAFFAGTALVLGSFSMLALLVNPVTASLTMAAVFVYVFLYTIVLKRRTPLANQVGGLAGALPPVIGYAAVIGGVDSRTFVLFLIMALWQQPHALSLALIHREDYRRASVPVMPVAKGVRATKLRILLYALALVPAAALPYFIGMAGGAFLAASLALSAAFVFLSARFLRSGRKSGSFLFFFSILYLTALLAAMVVDLS